MHIDITREGWRQLQDKLQKAHETPTPYLTATAIVEGWVSAYGACLESRADSYLPRIIRTCREAYLHEAIDADQIREHMRCSYWRWTSYLDQERQTHQTKDG
jgi:hypothetical protein